jgi:hypothetical protein
MAKILLRKWSCHFSFSRRRGWQLYADWKNRQKDQPRQTRRSPTYSRHNKTSAPKKRGIMSCAVILRVFQTRSLMRQRHPNPSHRTSDGQPSKPVGKIRETLISVGSAVGCDLLIFKHQDQKIAACGSSYTFRGVLKIS